MGVTISHGAWNGSCSAFNQMRRWVASQVGINLNEYAGYWDSTGTKDLNTLDHDLQPLLNHSDCDGILTPAECRRIIKGIKEALSNASDKSCVEYGWASHFLAGCVRAVNAEEEMTFL